ncbi:MAG: hypothetical protein QM770_05500 [Tepidisphaeraceae bacterium]
MHQFAAVMAPTPAMAIDSRRPSTSGTCSTLRVPFEQAIQRQAISSAPTTAIEL